MFTANQLLKFRELANAGTMTYLGILVISLFSINLVLALQTTSRNHVNNEMTDRHLIKTPVKDVGLKVYSQFLNMSRVKLGVGVHGTREKAIRSGDILPENSTEKIPDHNLVFQPDCFTSLHPCVETCVCSECPDTQEFIVDCSGKSLSMIPTGIPSNVTHLILNNNHIPKVQPRSFARLRRLEVLDLSDNTISRLQKESFMDLANLKSLFLDKNRLTLSNVSFHPGIFQPLRNLAVLNLKLNRINRGPSFQYFASEIGELLSLEELYMDGVSYANFGSAYGKLMRLNRIDLSGSKSLKYLGPDMFTSLKHVPVNSLNISHCYLKKIHPDTFKPLTKIDTLDLSYNPQLQINNTGLSFAGLVSSSIRRIFARQVNQDQILITVRTEDFKYLKRTQLEELYLDNNTIAQVDGGLQDVPKSLRVLSISWNDIQIHMAQILEIFFLENLEYLYASYQDQLWLRSDITYQEMGFNYSSIQALLGNFPGCDEVSALGVLKCNLSANLTEVHLSHTYKFRFAIPKVHLYAPKIKIIDLSYNLLHGWNGPVTGLETMEELDLSGNTCHDLSPGFFSSFEGLKILKIGDNLLGPNLDNGVFGGLDRLHLLDMHQVHMEEITPRLFSDLRDLKVLDLSGNLITSWNSRIFHFVNLTRLDLTSNRLSYLPKELLEDLDEISKHSNVNISLKGNPLLCNCDTKYFVHWLIHTKVRILHAHSTFCTLENGNWSSLGGPHLMSTYNVLELHCRTYPELMAVSSCIIIIAICIVTGKILHRYRWKLRYLYYMAVHIRERTEYERLDGIDQPPFTFNSFISYEDSHRDFVRLEMLPKLETEAGLKLCIDKRDFIPGFYIADNIMNAIQNSRKTVVLLSRKFLESKWCMYEFNMARMESIYSDRHSLLVVLMETIPVNQFPAEVLEILHSKSYISKTDDPDGMALFWRQLTAGIRLDENSA